MPEALDLTSTLSDGLDLAGGHDGVGDVAALGLGELGGVDLGLGAGGGDVDGSGGGNDEEQQRRGRSRARAYDLFLRVRGHLRVDPP